MARGGYRPGAGRPKGARHAKKIGATPKQVAVGARKARLTPLEYMLDVMNDVEADVARRDRMAVAAAPYTHKRAADEAPGKKERAAEAASTAGDGTDWGEDLRPTVN